MLLCVEDILPIIIPIILTMGLLWILYPAWLVVASDPIEWDVEQLSSSSSSEFPVTKLSQTPTISLIIPAYNEQDRINIMIRDTFDYLTSERGKKLLRKLKSCAKTKVSSDDKHFIEWIIVNDGSSDSTCDVVRKTHKNLIGKSSIPPFDCLLGWKWKIVSLKRNAGKGAAVKTGMNLAEGMFHLMVDADGATEFGNGIENLTDELHAKMQRFSISKENGKIPSSESRKERMVVVFGSRAYLEKSSTVQRSMVRTMLMKAFHFFVGMFVPSKVKDTQCGFKLFTKQASYFVFKNLNLRRWAFDIEIIMLCFIRNIDILEVAVPWHEVDGSKLSTSKLALATASVTMLRDMICVWACYTFGIWKVENM